MKKEKKLKEKTALTQLTSGALKTQAEILLEQKIKPLNNWR
ncbi:hypothetical protein [Pseudoalteromonas sp. Ps84H-4]|nr:hypothetical protein [Pseudoalteromonas sp. Ps84H-4]